MNVDIPSMWSRVLCNTMHQNQLKLDAEKYQHKREVEKQRTRFIRKIQLMRNEEFGLMIGASKHSRLLKLMRASRKHRLKRAVLEMKLGTAKMKLKSSRLRIRDIRADMQETLAELLVMETITVTGIVSRMVVDGLLKRGWRGRVRNNGDTPVAVEETNEWAAYHNIELV